jgi:uncharacterized protein YukE
VGSSAKSPSSLAPFACDWVGGDIQGLSAYAGTLYRYVPEITDVTGALNSKVSQIVSAAGWQGSAASSFTRAWGHDSAGATALAVAISACGDIVNTLAVNLARIESALEQAADEASAHGVPVGSNGEPPQVCLANPTEESWRVSYQGFWSDCMLTAAQARAEAVGGLQSLYAQIAPGSGDSGLEGSDYAALFDALAGFWGAQTRYRSYVEAKIPGLKQDVTQARTSAIEDARQANGQFGPWSEEDAGKFGDAKTDLASVQGDLVGAESDETWFSKAWGFSPSDIPGVSKAVEGIGGPGGELMKFAGDVPFVDIAAGGASTYFGAQQDIKDGVPWELAYPGEAAGNVAAIGTGTTVGGLAMGGTATFLGDVGGATFAAGGVGVLTGGVVAFGVGDFTHHLIDENWGADIHNDGVVLGVGYGVADSGWKTLKDGANIVSSVWNGLGL